MPKTVGRKQREAGIDICTIILVHSPSIHVLLKKLTLRTNGRYSYSDDVTEMCAHIYSKHRGDFVTAEHIGFLKLNTYIVTNGNYFKKTARSPSTHVFQFINVGVGLSLFVISSRFERPQLHSTTGDVGYIEASWFECLEGN